MPPSPKTTPPAIGTLLVHVGPGEASTIRLAASVQLAQDLGARLIGLGAESVEPLLATPYAGIDTAAWLAAMSQQMEADLVAARTSFDQQAAAVEREWREARDMPAHALAVVARACDLIIVSAHPSTNYFHAADPAEVVMRSGRPVLVMPDRPKPLSGKRVVVAWKDTREARRALADALPFLHRAEEVLVMGVCNADQQGAAQTQVDDVTAYLVGRGVTARGQVSLAADAGVVGELNNAADALGADLIVAGAYGQSRLREWVFGGVTRTLLDEPSRYLLLSH
ncbi:universal stress protein [Phenylobacterium sp.]|uniref:universal stress protein n=1 Tax=Phenylobacterium sp. TaxID=1871053 RepID=UPI002731B982|nr:universal stress protein [Phenylobacterium sp.]MDP1615927.1 universal stress protein [Phenylobacterium sp.]MDP1988718.1 universal stress protein [Phenylobacterium sp.]